jgi:hypothetical protein
MAIQTKTGKAFEYALLKELYERLKRHIPIHIIENESYLVAKKFFEEFDEDSRDAYRINSSAAINFILDIEPRLSNYLDKRDSLQLEIVSDSAGQAGDVRDILMIRSKQNWEIGISAKNNHRAVKHSRLSSQIDFGKKWLDISCSQTYFDEITPIFRMLDKLRSEDPRMTWNSIDNMHDIVYVPVLNAFKDELLRLQEKNENVARRLVEYLIGTEDFYKIIKGAGRVEIQAYNLHGSLNQSFRDIKPKAKIPQLKLPSRLIEIVYENDSKTTLLVSLNEGWQISFRIHNAKSTVEPSLKFDINLVSAPYSLFTNHILL